MVRIGAGVSASRSAASFGLMVIAVATAGCSADVARFDSPYFGLNDSPAATAPAPSRGLGGPTSLSEQQPEQSSGGAYYPPSSGRSAPPAAQGSGQGVRMSALPEPATPAPAGAPSPTRSTPAAAPSSQPARTQAPVARGETIEVQPGDTLYSISKKHHVSLSELSSLNNLSGPMIRPGQKLVLPASAKTAPAAAAAPAAKPAAPIAVAAAPPAAASAPVAAAAAPAADQPGTYTMRTGDSLYAVARKHKVTLEQLKTANGIADERRVRVGTVLKIPGAEASAPAAAPAVAAAKPAPAPAPVSAAPAAEPASPALSTRPTIINGAPKQVAALDKAETATDAAPVVAAEPAKSKGTEVASAATQAGGAVAGSKFRWPAKGKIVSSFGQRADGTHNDGVDIAVPLGTEVLAAEAGVVAYAGNELKGFGNLVLLRHDNGWVTAYAHNDTLLVKRGDKVRRGQAIAKAGKSGSVDQPTVHFEVRQGSKPVDPVPLLEKM